MKDILSSIWHLQYGMMETTLSLNCCSVRSVLHLSAGVSKAFHLSAGISKALGISK